MKAADAAYASIGIEGWIMAHMSHSYHSGACLYFTFAFKEKSNMLGEYDVVKAAIQQSFIDNGATLSHHHGVGVEHSPWMEQDISAQGVQVMAGLFSATDPKSNLNPGKILGARPQAPGAKAPKAASAAAKSTIAKPKKPATR